jgi:hypothetical protein
MIPEEPADIIQGESHKHILENQTFILNWFIQN